MKRPSTGTVCLLLALGSILWIASFRLGSNPPVRKDSTRRHLDPSGSWTDRPFPPPPSSSDNANVALVACRLTDPSGRPLTGAIVRTGDFEVCTDPLGRFALARDAAPIEIRHDGYFPLHATDVDDLIARRRPRVPGTEDATNAEDTDSPPLEILLFAGVLVRGQVRDADGREVADVAITIGRDLTRPIATSTTDAQGRWTSPLLRPGPVTLLFSHPDFLPTERNLLPSGRADTGNSAVVLEKGHPLTVLVRSRTGRSLADADVWIELHSNDNAVIKHYLGRADDLGSLACHRPPGQRGKIRARLAGYRDGTSPLATAVVSQGREVVEMRLGEAPRLAARAVDATSGLPVTLRRVELQTLVDGSFRALPHRGILFRALADGAIRAGLPPQAGTYRLVAHADGSLFGISKAVQFDGVTSPPRIVVRLEFRPSLTGIVVAESRPVRGADIELLGDDAENATLTTQSDATGRFTFAGVPTSSCRVAVRHSDFAETVSPRIDLPLPDAVGGLTIELQRGGTIRGKILTADGEPAADRPVHLDSHSCRARSTTTNAAGAFTFQSLPAADDFHVTVGVDRLHGANGMAPGSRGPLSVKPGFDTRCDLSTTFAPAGSLAGRIENDGRPLTCTLTVFGGSSTFATARVRTDANGVFLLRPLRPGSYRVVGVDYPFVHRAEVRAGERAQLTIGLETLDWDLDIVSADTGRSVGDSCRVVVTRTTAARTGSAKQVTLTGGSGRIGGLWPGRYSVRVEAEGYVTAERTYQLEKSGRSRIGLETGKAVSIRLVESSGALYRGPALVTVKQGPATVFQKSLQVDGVLELPALPRGNYNVEVKIGERSLDYKLTISSGD